MNRTEIGDFVVTGARNQLVCGEGFERRKAWIEERLELLAGVVWIRGLPKAGRTKKSSDAGLPSIHPGRWMLTIRKWFRCEWTTSARTRTKLPVTGSGWGRARSSGNRQ
ncbi:MAG: hypothetical protein KF851_19400 [Pirellulaceae bacterium]|nr:hypothetical protein [Pirellulaceae bacterium]